MTHISSDRSPILLGSDHPSPLLSLLIYSCISQMIPLQPLLLLLSLSTMVKTLAATNLDDIANPNKSADRLCGLGEKMTPLST